MYEKLMYDADLKRLKSAVYNPIEPKMNEFWVFLTRLADRRPGKSHLVLRNQTSKGSLSRNLQVT